MPRISVRLGDGVVIHGDVVVASSIKDSFNKALSADVPDGLSDLLKQIATAVGKMTEQQSEEDAKNSARDLDTLTSEATSKAPRRKWWELSVEGLRDAAKAVGNIGKPVLALLPKIAEALQGLG